MFGLGRSWDVGWRCRVMSLGSSGPQQWRADFPILQQQVHGKPLVYLDSAATTQKPQCVIDAICQYYSETNANVHRGVHTLSEKATQQYEAARDQVQQFIHANDRHEIVFVKGTTEAVNLVAQSFARPRLRPGDEVLITHMEHHSNIVPWQMVCEQTGAQLKVVPVNDDGELVLEAFDELLSDKTKFVSVVHVSNALGTVNPVKEIIERAHALDVPVLVDGAQAVAHLAVDVQDLGCDFYAFSGHKLYGPTGIGVLFGKAELLDAMVPYQGGGDMISSVRFEKTEYNVIPFKFEAGTPNIAGVIGLGAAIGYLDGVGLDKIKVHEDALLVYGTEALQQFEGLRLIGTAGIKASILSFVMEKVHAHDISTIVDLEGVALRAGHHCAMPLMDRFHVSATARASIALYNNEEDIDVLVKALRRVEEVFA